MIMGTIRGSAERASSSSKCVMTDNAFEFHLRQLIYKKSFGLARYSRSERPDFLSHR